MARFTVVVFKKYLEGNSNPRWPSNTMEMVFQWLYGRWNGSSGQHYIKATKFDGDKPFSILQGIIGILSRGHKGDNLQVMSAKTPLGSMLGQQGQGRPGRLCDTSRRSSAPTVDDQTDCYLVGVLILIIKILLKLHWIHFDVLSYFLCL